MTSRQHARIEFRRGKFVLVDQSTNGTWVRGDDGKDHYLRREELALWGEGMISLGDRIHPEHPATIRYRTRY
jgi:predicted component of type VI protein secretion system